MEIKRREFLKGCIGFGLLVLNGCRYFKDKSDEKYEHKYSYYDKNLGMEIELFVKREGDGFDRLDEGLKYKIFEIEEKFLEGLVKARREGVEYERDEYGKYLEERNRVLEGSGVFAEWWIRRGGDFFFFRTPDVTLKYN